nr:MAG TPA: hypothetical protein [Caudoviricetes sp.]
MQPVQAERPSSVPRGPNRLQKEVLYHVLYKLWRSV